VAAFFAAAVVAPTAVALAAAPGNDNFSSASVIDPAGGATTASNVDATAESGEPDHADSTFEALHSVWFAWTAPASGPATVSTCGSAFNTRLGVYTGDAIGSLTKVVANEDSSGPNCAGSKFAEASFDATGGTTYRIAVDTSGDLAGDGSGPPQGEIKLALSGPKGETQPAGEKWQPKVPNTVQFEAPDFGPVCDNSKPIERRCTFKGWDDVQAFLGPLEAKRVPTGYGEQKLGSTDAPKGMKTTLRTSGKGGEILAYSVRLEGYDGSNSVVLEPGKPYSIETGQNRILRVHVDVFDLAKDKKAAAEREEQMREKADKKGKEPESKCSPIRFGLTPKQVANALLSKHVITTFDEATKIFNGLGCNIEIARYAEGPVGDRRSYVSDIVGYVKDRDVITVEYTQPREQDFLFTIREDPARMKNRLSLGIGSDGALTQAKQSSFFTVQVIERATGRLVSGLPVTFTTPKDRDGAQRTVTTTTDAQGDAPFQVALEESGEAMLEARFGTMTGHRTISVVDRRSKRFTSMSGRQMVWTPAYGAWGSKKTEFEVARAFPVAPANLGTGLSGAAHVVPRIVQAGLTRYDASGREYAATGNAVSVPDDSNMIVGAAPGMVAVAGGLAEQVGRSANHRQSFPNPFQLLGSVLGPLATAVNHGIGTVATALSSAQQAAVAQMGSLFTRPEASLISDKGLGVISSNSGGVIATDGATVIATDGATLIGQAGGNLIGNSSNTLIGNSGNTLIGNSSNTLMPVRGGRIISEASGVK
jgi:hypothetical protein